MGDVPPGLVRVPLGGFGRRDRAQQLPEELHVNVVQRPAHGEVVQLVRGKGVQFVTCHPWTLSPVPLITRPAPARGAGYYNYSRPRASGSRPGAATGTYPSSRGASGGRSG